MHFLKALKNGGEFLEFSIEGEDYYPWQKNIFASDPFAVENGDLTIHNTPGWGVDFNQTWLDKATYQCSSKND